jgi:WD40 repeat protein
MEYNPNSTTANDFALFSPDGKNILTLNDHGFAMMWQTGKGKNPVFVFRHSELILSARYSKNGKYILTTGDDQTARVWDAYTGKPVGPSIKHEDEINSAVFSLNQKEILTSSSDKTVRLWEIISGKQIGASIKHDKEVSNAIFSPDGADILTLTNDDSTGRLWDMPGDLDIPSDLMKLQARVSTGYELNLQTNELQLILPELWYKLEAEYNKKAREHAKICKYPKYNFWRRFNAGDAEKL